MARRQLKQPPLVEAILEVKWALQPGEPSGIQIDDAYNLLPGRLYDRIQGDYPFYEKLPAASIPDEISPYVVKHRFRVGRDGWPLIQAGPGILTVNDTEEYSTFEKFRPRAISAVGALFESYPGALNVNSLLLRYIDAVEFDYLHDHVWEFMADEMGVSVSLPARLFNNSGVLPTPRHFSSQASFECERPRGTATLRFSTGKRKDDLALIWEHIVKSVDEELPEMPTDFPAWLDQAHSVTDDWFFKLIEGKLVRRLNGE